MDDLVRIARALRNHDLQHEPLVVATVVDTIGSAYRRPGARALIAAISAVAPGTSSLPDSHVVRGSISAGCLESDVCEHARRLQPGESSLITYDTTAQEDELLLGIPAGCGGTTRILLERIQPGSPFEYLSTLDITQPFIATTIFESSDPQLARLGLALVRTEGRCWFAPTLDDRTKDLLGSHASCLPEAHASCLPGSHASSVPLRAGNCTFTALIEPVQPIPALMVFGNGTDAKTVVSMAQLLGWSATLSDGCDPTSAAHHSHIIVMTHNFTRDRRILGHALESSARYIAVVGPRKRTQQLLAALPPDRTSGRLHAPAGLDIGAEHPEEIALAILAEIKAVLSNHNGGFLRSKAGPIHNPTTLVPA